MNDVLARLTAALGTHYTVDRELGAGGMATVYLAHDIKHDRDVAIKVLHPDLGAALGGERFLSEIRTTARLQHPHILPLSSPKSSQRAGVEQLAHVLLIPGSYPRLRRTVRSQPIRCGELDRRCSRFSWSFRGLLYARQDRIVRPDDYILCRESIKILSMAI